MKNKLNTWRLAVYVLILFATAFQAKAGAPKEKIQEYCPVHGIYTRYVDYNGVVVHVCAFVSDKQVCYLMLCNEMHQVKKIQTGMPVKFPIEEGKKALLIPRNGGYEVIYYERMNVQEDNQSVSITLE